MYRRQPSDSLTVKDKITLLKAEIGDRVLTGNQLKIYRAFTKMTGRPTAIETVDANRDMIRFKIYSNKNDDGTIHILQKHYKTNIGYVSAIEIVNGIEDSGRERLYPEIILFRQIKKCFNDGRLTSIGRGANQRGARH